MAIIYDEVENFEFVVNIIIYPDIDNILFFYIVKKINRIFYIHYFIYILFLTF